MSNFKRKMNKNEAKNIKKEMEKIEKDFYKDQRTIFLNSPLNLRQEKINTSKQ